MSRRVSPFRNPAASSLVLATLCAIASACGLDVSGTGQVAAPIVDPTTVAGADASVTPATGTPSTPPLATADAGLADDASTPTEDAALPPIVEADAAAPACDVDGDGHDSAACGGDDCCDTDARTHPGTTSYYASANACGSFDYDCSGEEEKRYPVSDCKMTNFKCQGDGFAEDTDCGSAGLYDTCTWKVVCVSDTSTEVQRCR